MKRFKKFMAGVIALAMVLGMVGVMPAVEAKAADAPTAAYDYTTGKLTITNGSGAKYTYIGIGKNGNEPKVYDVFLAGIGGGSGTTVIDLSSYGSKKDLELYIHDDIKKDDLKFTISANTDKIKAKYVPNGAAITDIITLDGAALDATLEYRLGNGSWVKHVTTPLTIDMIDTCSVYGATIYFRTVGGANKFASAEAKLKIPKAANAPKVTIDYNKMTIKFPKNVEFKGSGAAFLSTINTAGETLTLTEVIAKSTNTIGTLADGVKFALRTKATDKKVASKINFIDISKQVDLKTGNDPLVAKVTIAHTFSDDKGTTKVEIKNATDFIIEYFIADDNTETVPKDKWIKIGIGKSGGVKSDTAGKFVIWRIASYKDKETGVSYLPSTIIKTDAITALKLPTWGASKKPIDVAIKAAQDAIKQYKISTNGEDVKTTDKWVQQSDVTTLTTAITAATTAKGTKDVTVLTATEVTNAVTTLTAAITTFNGKAAAGKKAN